MPTRGRNRLTVWRSLSGTLAEVPEDGFAGPIAFKLNNVGVLVVRVQHPYRVTQSFAAIHIVRCGRWNVVIVIIIVVIDVAVTPDSNAGQRIIDYWGPVVLFKHF